MNPALTAELRRALLEHVLGDFTQRHEHRFRHSLTGATKSVLDARVDHFVEWESEERLVIETAWGQTDA